MKDFAGQRRSPPLTQAVSLARVAVASGGGA